MRSWCRSNGGTIPDDYNTYFKDRSGYMGSGCHLPQNLPCMKGSSNGTQPNVSTGTTEGDILNLGANLWIMQNIKNPYTAVFAQNFSQGFFTGLFANDTPEARRQRELEAAALRQRQLEEAERARIAEQQRIDAVFARLNNQLKLSGNNSQLALKTAGTSSNLSLKLSSSGSDSGLQMKLGGDPSPGYGIQGLPGIYVGGPASAPANSADNPNGLKLKIGDSSAPDAAAPPATAGIPGLPGIYLNNVEPAQAAQVADAAANLSGSERDLAEDAALQAAQKNPALTAPSDDPLVQDFQAHAKDYDSALQARQEALQQASEAQGHVQADQAAVEYARGQLNSSAPSPQQQEAFQKMLQAANSDEGAAMAARQMFENSDAHLSIVRENSANALAGLAQPATVPSSSPLRASSPGVQVATISSPVPTNPAPMHAAPAAMGLNPSARPASLATPPSGGAPYVESLAACVARVAGGASGTRPTPSLEDLQKQLESERKAFDRIAKTARRANEDRNDWLKDMRKAAQDMGTNALDHGVEGLFDSTKEGLQEAEIELHSEIEATKKEAIQLRQSMLQTRQAMDAAKNDPARLAELTAQWNDLEKNGITPLLEKRKALEGQWENYFKWERHVASFNSARDFGGWLTDMELPCQRTNGEISCKNFLENNPIAKSEKGDPNASLDGLKQVLKFGAHLTPYGETWDAVSTFIDVSFDLSTEVLGYQRLQQIKQNSVQFEKAENMLGQRIERTNAEIDCYQKSH